MIDEQTNLIKLKRKLTSLEKIDKQSKLYLNHLKIYNKNLDKSLFSTKSSIMYKLSVVCNEIINFILNPFIQIKNACLWKEITAFSQSRNRNNIDIINFSVIPYNFRFLRQQHLVENLAYHGHRIFYIENYFIDKQTNKKKISFQIKKQTNNVYIVTLAANRNLFIYNQQANKDDIKSIIRSLKQLMQKAQITHAVVKIDHPFWAYLLEQIKLPVIYDCMDDYSGFAVTGGDVLQLEKKLLKKANLVIVCSATLYNKMKSKITNDSLLIKNGADYSFFKTSASKHLPVPLELENISQPILGYFGAIGEWFDQKLIELMANTFPQLAIVLIGEVRNPKLTELTTKYSNIYLLGEKPYSILPQYLQKFTVCLIPFIINKSTKIVDPVKLYEYFASGKPVVSTDIVEIYPYKNLCYISKNRKEFIINIKKALDENDPQLIINRQKIAQENTWNKRAKLLNKAILKMMNS